MIEQQTLLGLRVVQSATCVTREPVKVLKRKRWMSEPFDMWRGTI